MRNLTNLLRINFFFTRMDYQWSTRGEISFSFVLKEDGSHQFVQCLEKNTDLQHRIPQVDLSPINWAVTRRRVDALRNLSLLCTRHIVQEFRFPRRSGTNWRAPALPESEMSKIMKCLPCSWFRDTFWPSIIDVRERTRARLGKLKVKNRKPT